MGPYSRQCPNVTGVGLDQVDFVLTKSNKGNNTIKKSWMLLDTCSTHSVSNNPDMVMNVKLCSKDNVLMIFSKVVCFCGRVTMTHFNVNMSVSLNRDSKFEVA